jgi:hypothetical protein
MLKKVAMCQGFRLAFPDEMGGMPFAPEELGNIIDVTPEHKGKPEVKDPEAITPETPIDPPAEIPTDAPTSSPEASQPEQPAETGEQASKANAKPASTKQCVFIANLLMHWKDGVKKDEMLKYYKVKLFNELTSAQASEAIKILQDQITKDKAKETKADGK